MWTTHPNYGQNYRLVRAALRLRTFTVAELQSLTGAFENTIYAFIHKLTRDDPGFLEAKELTSEGRGRPPKQYFLTEAGVDHLIRLDFELAARFGEGETSAFAPIREEPTIRSGIIKVILADKMGIFRTGVAKVLGVEDDLRMVAQAENAEKMMTALAKFHATVMIFGADVYPRLPAVVETARKYQTKLIAIAETEQESHYCLTSGIQGVIYRNVSEESLIKCVRTVAKGETWVQGSQENKEAAENDLVGMRVRDRLTAKELKIIALIVQGYTNKEIATQLGTTQQVIKNYLRNVYDKIGVSDRLELALFTIHHRILAEVVGVEAKQGVVS